MLDIKAQIQLEREKIQQACVKAGRNPNEVQLLAVSKRQPVAAIRAAIEAGQICFGENMVQEALEKMHQLARDDIAWHFIGPIQSNKTREIATHFDWVHSLSRLKIAKRLNQQRPTHLGPLNVCIQINTSGEASKSGIRIDEAHDLIEQVSPLNHLKVRGLMTIPSPDLKHAEVEYANVQNLYHQLIDAGYPLDTLSMGMSNDMELAIQYGATIVRIGSAIFGQRSNE